MSRRNKTPLPERVAQAAEAALADQGSVSPIDMLRGIRWLDPNLEKDWRLGRIDCLEAAMQTSPARIAEALGALREWTASRGLLASEADYVTRTPQREKLRFTRDGNPDLERLYRTHWLSSTLPEKTRERLVEKASKPPELVVVAALKPDWKCHRCDGGGGLLMMENGGPACLKCVGLDDLEFLGAGDALLTRRAKAKSARFAVVVRFSRTRKRYERQGLLVEKKALAAAEREIERERRQ